MRSSKRETPNFPHPATEPPSLSAEFAVLRHRASAGNLIPQHRAFIRLAYGGVEKLNVIVSPLLIFGGWLFINRWVAEGWYLALETARVRLRLPGSTSMAIYQITPALQFGVPFMNVPASPPNTKQLVLFGVFTIVLLAVSFIMRERHLPIAYGLRAICLVNFTAIVYLGFLASPTRISFPRFTLSGLATGYGVISAVPLLFGLIYFIFDIALWKKVGLTLLTMAHLAILLPLQYTMHAWLVYHASALVLPMLLIFFGILLEVMVCVAFYGWGMSWSGKEDPEP